jgi:hypothetical protein
MRGAIPPLPQYVFMALCLVKHRDNCTFHSDVITYDSGCRCLRKKCCKKYFVNVGGDTTEDWKKLHDKGLLNL